MREAESRSDWVFGVSVAQVILMLCFASMITYVTDNVEGGGQEPPPIVEAATPQHPDLQARLDAATERSNQLEKQLGDMTVFVDQLKDMVGAKVPSKEGFQEAIDGLKRGYSFCQRNDNTLIEATIENGVETIHVIGETPFDMEVNLATGDQTSDVDQIVSFLQDVHQYEKDHKCRFNYRLRYASDNDYRKAREGFEKYFYPEKMIRIG